MAMDRVITVKKLILAKHDLKYRLKVKAEKTVPKSQAAPPEKRQVST